MGDGDGGGAGPMTGFGWNCMPFHNGLFSMEPVDRMLSMEPLDNTVSIRGNGGGRWETGDGRCRVVFVLSVVL